MVVENTKFWKERESFQKRKIVAYFFRIIECDKPYGTIYKGPEANLTSTVEVFRSFPLDLRACWKHKFLEKSNVSNEEKFCPVFPRSVEGDKPHGTVCKCQKVGLAKTRSYNNLSETPKRLLETQKVEKRQSFQWRKIMALSSRIIGCDKHHGTNRTCPQDILSLTGSY